MGKITQEDRILIKALRVEKKLELSPLSEGICQQSLVQIKPWMTDSSKKSMLDFLKFASHHFLLYAIYICKKSLNFTYAFKCYQ